MLLRDKVAIITGGAGLNGLGFATARLIGTDIIKGKLDERRKAEIAESIPLGRLGHPRDIDGACVFFASDLSACCTGVTLDVNGGMLIH